MKHDSKYQAAFAAAKEFLLVVFLVLTISLIAYLGGGQ